MQEKAPRSAHRHKFRELKDVYYGTDDGHPDPRPAHVFPENVTGELDQLKRFYEGVDEKRKEDIHLVSVVGGFYGLNLIPLFRPREITLFDVNPYQITYGELVLRVLGSSANADDFLRRLAAKDYEVSSEEERFIQENISRKQRGLDPDTNRRRKRSLEKSWGYALQNFDLTQEILSQVPIRTRVEQMQGPSFRDYVRDLENAWIFSSNIFLFVYFELEFTSPENVALIATYFSETEIVDLADLDGSPAVVQCKRPMSVAVKSYSLFHAM